MGEQGGDSSRHEGNAAGFHRGTLCPIPACRNAEDARRAAQAQVASQGYSGKTVAPPSSGNGRAAALLPGAAGKQRRPAVPHTHRCGCRTPSDVTWCTHPAPSAISTPWPRRALRGFYRLPRTPCPSPRPEEGVGSAGGGGGRLRSGAEREKSAYNPRSSRRRAAPGPAGHQRVHSAPGRGERRPCPAPHRARTASVRYRAGSCPCRAARCCDLGPGQRRRSGARVCERVRGRAGCAGGVPLLRPTGGRGNGSVRGARHGRAGPAERGGRGIVPRGCRFWKRLARDLEARIKPLRWGGWRVFKKEDDAPGSYFRARFRDRSQRRRQVEPCSRSLTL